MDAGGTIHNVPPEVKAKWPELNSVDPIRRTWLPQYAISLQAIAMVIIAVRLWSRFKHVSGGLGIDDALITAALVRLSRVSLPPKPFSFKNENFLLTKNRYSESS
jgi:hypothetical protein